MVNARLCKMVRLAFFMQASDMSSFQIVRLRLQCALTVNLKYTNKQTKQVFETS